MDAKGILQLTSELIGIRSISGSEHEAGKYIIETLRGRGWEVNLIPVENGRENILVSFGEPRILFSTHYDVVPAPDALFEPRWEGEKLVGRGACDAKGILATMIATAEKLLSSGANDFGLLFVVGEEVGGDGARAAAKALKGRVSYLVNGEPTEGKIYTAHKGVCFMEAEFSGKACHSGYPHLGDDANAKLIRACAKILEADLGEDPVLGKATVNLGLINGGVATNVVSPKATVSIMVRSVTDNSLVERKLKEILCEASSLSQTYGHSPSRMLDIPGFEKGLAAYSTDIPHFQELGAEFVLYGPGTIHVAHTDKEFITEAMVAESLEGYQKIYHHLLSA